MVDPLSCVSPILHDALAWLRDYVKDDLQALVNLEDSWVTLIREMKELEAEKNDLEKEVRLKESPILGKTDKVSLWMDSVNNLKSKVDEFDADFRSSPCFPECCAPAPLWRRYKLIRTASDLPKQVRNLRSQSKFEAVVAEAPHDPNRGVSDPPMIDGEETMEVIRRCLAGDKEGIIGIYGMGGVGKTTLLKKIQYESRESKEYACVVWVDVSRRMDAALLRESIGKYLGFSQPEAVQVDDLRTYLSQRSFLLLLDNLWEELSPSDVGIPVSDGSAKRKIVFTTRLKSVCDAMGAHGIKVNMLKADSARKLFKVSVGNQQIFDNSPIQASVEDVVSECGGLPLAVKIVGRVMASMDTDDDWRDAAKQLKESPAEIQQVEEKVFKVLQFSFDNLDEKQKECLLFCALFPDKHDINRTQLVEYWIAEGLLDVKRGKDLEAHHRKGRSVINHLISSCLLEKGSNEQKEVRMHDVVRDVALWIAAERFSVNMRWGSLREIDAESWEDAQRISIIHDEDNVKLPMKPTCSSLSTLLIRHNSSIKKVPEQFFSFLPVLRVLDFSGTKIEVLPGDIGKLRKLQYLNLSHTVIRSLPQEVGDLEQLRHLNLSYTAYLRRIPYRLISRLSNLWVLNMFQSRYDSWEVGHSNTGDEQGQAVSFRELEGLKELQEFGLNLRSLPVLERFLSSPLLESTTCLYLLGFPDFAPNYQYSIFHRMKKLQELHIGHFFQLRDLTFRELLNVEVLKLFDLPNARILWQPEPNSRCRLRCLEISECNELKDLDWIKHFMCLETISLSKCDKLQDVVKRDGGQGNSPVTLPRLKEITLRSLPNLESIFGRSVSLPSLESFKCYECPKLTNFLFQKGDARILVEIHGEQGRWDGLH